MLYAQWISRIYILLLRIMAEFGSSGTRLYLPRIEAQERSLAEEYLESFSLLLQDLRICDTLEYIRSLCLCTLSTHHPSRINPTSRSSFHNTISS